MLNTKNLTADFNADLHVNDYTKNIVNSIRVVKDKDVFTQVEKDLEFNTFEIDQKILEKINIKSKENIEKNTVEEKSEKSYRRKIKKKTNNNTN